MHDKKVTDVTDDDKCYRYQVFAHNEWFRCPCKQVSSSEKTHVYYNYNL